MINRSQKGSRYERLIVKAFREKGYISVRSSNSQSPIDVWAINPETKEILLIQAKAGKPNKKEKERILEEMKGLNGLFRVRFEYWQK